MTPTIAASVAVSGVLRTPARRCSNIKEVLSLVSTRPFRFSAFDTRQDQHDPQRLAQARPYSCESVGHSSRTGGGSLSWPQNQHQIGATSAYYYPGNRFQVSAASNTGTIRFRQTQRRSLTFSFAGPRKLDELIKKELLNGKTGTEIADLWYTYHEEKVSNMLIQARLVFIFLTLLQV